MFRVVLLLLALPFLLLGAEGLVNAVGARHQATVTCEQFAAGDRPSLRLRLTDCAIDYSGSAYRESGARIQELFFPAQPAGRRGPVALVVVTSDPAALQIARAALGNRRQPTATESTAAMQKAAEAAGAAREISGLIRSGVLQRFASQRVLSGIGVPLADNVGVLDLQARPDFLFPVLEVAAGLALLVTVFLMSRESAPIAPEPDSSDREAVLERLRKHTEALRMAEEGTGSVGAAPAAPPVAAHERRPPSGERQPRALPDERRPSPPQPRRSPEPERRPAIMLLNVGDGANLADIESAPPLGPRADVIARLRKVLPDLGEDTAGRWRRVGPDYFLELDLGAGEIVHTIVLETGGRGGVSMARTIIESTGWRAFVPKSGRFLDADSLELADNAVSLR